jgi:mono/diheme cytochrome c family protein
MARTACQKDGRRLKNFNDPAWKKAATVDSIVKDTKDGVGKMKGMGDKLNAEQMKAIAEYTLTLANKAPFSTGDDR